MDYAAVAEGHRIMATWIAGTPKSKELVLCGEDGDGSFLLSANVRHGEEGEECPWYLTFYEEEESMCVSELGYPSWRDAVAAAEKWFTDVPLDVDSQSIVPAAYELGYLLGKQDAGCDYAEIGELAEISPNA